MIDVILQCEMVAPDWHWSKNYQNLFAWDTDSNNPQDDPLTSRVSTDNLVLLTIRLKALYTLSRFLSRMQSLLWIYIIAVIQNPQSQKHKALTTKTILAAAAQRRWVDVAKEMISGTDKHNQYSTKRLLCIFVYQNHHPCSPFLHRLNPSASIHSMSCCPVHFQHRWRSCSQWPLPLTPLSSHTDTSRL